MAYVVCGEIFLENVCESIFAYALMIQIYYFAKLSRKVLNILQSNIPIDLYYFQD